MESLSIEDPPEEAIEIRNVVIIGSGVAGYVAAIYTARAMLNPLMVNGYMYGGQLMTTTDIENYPGFVDGISGPKLMGLFYEQSKRFGTEFAHSDVKSIDTSSRPFEITLSTGYVLFSHSIIIATGARALWLDIAGEEKLRSRGVSTCATCDGAFYKDCDIVVVGGGDTAMEEATFLTRYATKVTIVHRKDTFKASKIMLERAKQNTKIDWKTNSQIVKYIQDDSDELCGVIIKDNDGVESKLDCKGVFVAIGHKPSTDFLTGSGVELDMNGYILHMTNTMTSVDGIFAAGDVVDTVYKQAITAAGQGCQAAIDCIKWLDDI